MRVSRGIFIAESGKSVGKGSDRYRSDRPHLMASLIKDPPHMDILTFDGGAGSTVAPGNLTTETLTTIKHNLPYTPEVLVYFYAVSYGGDPNHIKAGLYGADRIIYSGSAGTVTDMLYASVNETNLDIIHSIDVSAFFTPGSYVSDANQYIIRLKYYILSNDSHVQSYNTRGY